MNLNYEILFMIEVLDDYFANLQCTDLDITPTADTVALLKGQQMLYKTVGNKGVVLTKIVNAADGSDKNDTGKPYIDLAPNAILRFYVAINNPDFVNYTNLNYRPSTSDKYYFTNLNQTSLNTALFLNNKIGPYNNNNTYAIGDFAADGSNNIFEAIRGSSSANKHALADTAYWLNKGQAQFVSKGDSISLTGSSYIAATAAATTFTITVFGLNTATNVYDNQLLSSTQQYATAQTSIPVDLSVLPPAKYRISVNGADAVVYLDDTAINQNILGIIEIFNHLPAANNFALFDAAGLPKQSTFTLRFANRSAIWKYITRTSNVTAITDTSSAYSFSTVAASKTFISNKPIPFKDQPITTIAVHTAALGNVTPIANPGTNRLSNIIQNGELYPCTEKHLNF